MTKGGYREGSGRKMQNSIRERKTLRAYDDEWDLIRRFSHILKYYDRDACEDFIHEQETKFNINQENAQES